MLGALAVGRTEITGLLEGEDVLATAAALRALGAAVGAGRRRPLAGRRRRHRRPRRAREPARSRQFRHRGAAPPRHPRDPSAHRLRHRRRLAAPPADEPRDRAAEPVRRAFRHPRGRPPAARRDRRAPSPVPIAYRLPVPSAQVKSAVLLAGLNTPGDDHGHRAAGDPRPYRAHAAPFRRDGRDRARRGRRPADHRRAASPSSPRRRSRCRATRPRRPSRWSPR